jgi:hypothetical protein
MKPTLVLIALLNLIWLPGTSYSQPSADWTAVQKNPQVFIENYGQYNEYFTQDTSIQFGIDHGFGWRVLFSKNKVAFLVQHLVQDKIEPTASLTEEYEVKEVESSLIVQEWLNTNNESALIAENETYDYYTYAYLKNNEYINVDHAKAFQQLRRNDIYPGIDINWVAPDEGGVKYTLHLSPGADPGSIAFTYTGTTVSLDADGNLRMPTVDGDLIDYAPKAWYADQVTETIPCSFNLNGTTIGFSLGTYDNTREIIIDPWTVNPALPAPFNRAFEVDADNAGNVYVFGGGMGYNLKKYNAAGTLQWTHVSPWDTSNAWFGELLTLPAGDCFITSGSAAKIRRLTTAGATTFTNNGPFFNVDEYWNLSLNCDNTKLVAGGTRIVGLTSPQGHLFNLNMANGNQVAGSPYNIRPTGMKEVRGLAIGGDGNFYAFSNDNLVAVNQTFGIIYSVAHTNAFPYNSPTYLAKSVQGVNNIDANLTHTYISYGSTVEKRLNTTGAVVATAAIGAGGFTGGFFGTGPTNSGLAVDDCGNVYVGSTNAIHKFDANLNLITSVATTGAVYDIKIAPGGVILWGGNALVTSNTSLAPCAPHSITCTPPLPVEMSQFNGYAEGKTNHLYWSTYSEINNDHFIVEKSKDAINYETHSIIDGAGNSNSVIQYECTDPRPYPTTYYRLKQVDFNGDIKYYGPVVLENNQLSGLQVQSIYPNPAHEIFNIRLFNITPTNTHIQVYDAVGKLMESRVMQVAGEVTCSFHSSSWSAGLYIIKVINTDNQEETNHRIIIE